MVLLVGQVGTEMLDREAFQEVDYRKMFGPGVGLAKWAAQIDNVDRIPEYLSRAFSLACSGRPGHPASTDCPLITSDCGAMDHPPTKWP